MVRLQHRRLFKHKKGYAGILASIFLVLVVLYVYYNMYMVAQNRNLAFQDATSQSQQLDFDRSIEGVTISDVSYSASGVSLTIKNTGPLPIQLVRFWAQNSQAQSATLSFSPPILLDSGSKISQFFAVGINGVSTGDIAFWFVTARGNLISPNANYVP
jgi:hypothetical protein